MSERGSKRQQISIVSLNPVKMGDWIFKVSTYDGIVMVTSYNELFKWTSVRFFGSESAAKNFIEYLCLQSENLKEKD